MGKVTNLTTCILIFILAITVLFNYQSDLFNEAKVDPTLNFTHENQKLGNKTYDQIINGYINKTTLFREQAPNVSDLVNDTSSGEVSEESDWIVWKILKYMLKIFSFIVYIPILIYDLTYQMALDLGINETFAFITLTIVGVSIVFSLAYILINRR